MKNLTKLLTATVLIALTVGLFSKTSFAQETQDATVAAPDHYTIEFENDQVRVVRIKYGPHEKSVMHTHPAGVYVFLTDGEARFAMPDGTTQESSWDAKEVSWDSGTIHLPENTSDEPFEILLIELKEAKGKNSKN